MPFPLSGGFPMALVPTAVQVATGSVQDATAIGGGGFTPVPVAGAGMLALVFAKRTGSSPVVNTPSGWTREGEVTFTSGNPCRVVLFSRANQTGGEGQIFNCTETADLGIDALFWQSSNNVTGFEGASVINNAASSTSVPFNSVTTSAALGGAVTITANDGALTTIGSATGESGGDWIEAQAEAKNIFFFECQFASMPTPGTISGGTATLGAARTNRVVASIGVKA